MGWVAIANVVRLPCAETKPCSVSTFDVEKAAEAQQHVTLRAPVVGEVSGSVLDHAYAYIAKCAGTPNSATLVARMFGGSNLSPVRDRHCKRRHLHNCTCHPLKELSPIRVHP